MTEKAITLDGLRADHLASHFGYVWQCEECSQIWKEAKLIGGMMHTGMMWWDNSTKPLAKKIQEGVAYYQNKYDRVPDLCLVHPSALENQTIAVGTITVRPYRPVLPGHIWIGIEDKS